MMAIHPDGSRPMNKSPKRPRKKRLVTKKKGSEANGRSWNTIAEYSALGTQNIKSLKKKLLRRTIVV